MPFNYKQLLWVFLWFLINQISSSEFDKLNVSSIVEKQEVFNNEQEQHGLKEETRDNIKPVEIQKRIIHDDCTILTYDQKYCVYAGVYPVVELHCHAQSSFITRLITAFLWHQSRPRLRMMAVPNRSHIQWCQFSADSTWFVTLCKYKSIALWHVATAVCQWSVPAHRRAYVYQVILSSDDRYIISASRDKTLEIRTFLTGTRLYTLYGHTDSVRSCSLSVNNHALLSASTDQTLRVWSVQDGQCTHILLGHSTAVYWAAFYAHGRRIVSAGIELRLWDVETNHCVGTLYGHTANIGACHISPDEQLVLSASDDTTVRVWNLTTGKCVQIFRGQTHFWAMGGWFLRRNTWVAFLDSTSTVCIWSIRDGHCIHQFADYNTYQHWSLQHVYWLQRRDTECIISTENSPYEVHVIDVESGEKMWTFTTQDCISAVCVSPDGQYLIAGSVDGTVSIFVFSEHVPLKLL